MIVCVARDWLSGRELVRFVRAACAQRHAGKMPAPRRGLSVQIRNEARCESARVYIAGRRVITFGISNDDFKEAAWITLISICSLRDESS